MVYDVFGEYEKFVSSGKSGVFHVSVDKLRIGFELVDPKRFRESMKSYASTLSNSIRILADNEYRTLMDFENVIKIEYMKSSRGNKPIFIELNPNKTPLLVLKRFGNIWSPYLFDPHLTRVDIAFDFANMNPLELTIRTKNSYTEKWNFMRDKKMNSRDWGSGSSEFSIQIYNKKKELLRTMKPTKPKRNWDEDDLSRYMMYLDWEEKVQDLWRLEFRLGDDNARNFHDMDFFKLFQLYHTDLDVVKLHDPKIYAYMLLWLHDPEVYQRLDRRLRKKIEEVTQSLSGHDYTPELRRKWEYSRVRCLRTVDLFLRTMSSTIMPYNVQYGKIANEIVGLQKKLLNIT